jgi:crotonobetainyl-CoA:carnitine CoA-transferase CaiB-like acyl-CoA transferase
MHKPLAGIRIIAVEQYGAGPYGSMFLADLGAEVIKIENPKTGGDVSRATGPYFLGENDSEFFQTFNRNKKSVCIDLKSEEGRAAFEALVKSADAVCNNLRGDQPAKLKIAYDDLKHLKSEIVCAHLSAYGRDNERASWPGYDYLMQAEAGFLSLTGEPDGPPARFGLSMVDFMTGMTMAFGLVSSVLGAKTSGQGCDVDVSLFDVALHQLSYPATWYLNQGAVTTRLSRSSHPSTVPSQLFKTRDGWLLLMCQTPKFWKIFCQKVGCEEWLSDPALESIKSRRENRELVQEKLDALFGEQDTQHWIELLSGAVPIAPVYDIAEALNNPYAAEVGMLNTVNHPANADLRMLSNPLKISGERPENNRAPSLGEHTDEIIKAE